MTRALRAAAALAAALALVGAVPAVAASTSATVNSSSQVTFQATGVSWADVHYIVNGGTQLNVRMTQSGTTASYVVSGLSAGSTVKYFFTYAASGSSAAVDTSWATVTTTSSSSTTTTDSCTACKYHTLVWSDEFATAGQPSSTYWNYHVGNGYSGGFQGWGNGEWEWYRPEQCYVADGKLVLKAEYDSTATTIAGSNWYQWSCRITTQGKLSWKYARVEARIAMPSKTATWPAFWMLGDSSDGTYTTNYAASMSTYDTMSTNWASCGEIDIMEHVNKDTVAYQNLFWDTRTGVYPYQASTVSSSSSTASVSDVTAYHTYAMEWDASTMYWYIDNVLVKTQGISASTQEEYTKKFFVILNLALAGSFPNTTPVQSDFPLYMYVDYVRVYQ
jgi:beta-glucanase (GH16 family)